MWDDKGKPWSLELLTHETLTSTLRTPPVFEEDVAFIKAQNLDARIQRVRMRFSRASFKKSEWRSPGMVPHLFCAFYGEVGMYTSKACPRIIDGDERDDITRQDGACFRYFCPGGQRCKCRHKRCFDCQRIKGTAFEDLIPNDEGHHWALGNVLHKELRIRELEDDGRRLTLEDNGRRVTGLWQVL
ncbi:unnamed protein product [Heligmosomoides polygyrus]|uniref:C3H1-type domain-containing protein n=1 Tax=Heligmosomoides polygyrus TaxID=6339 RepID=A0A183FRI7_HELPZ|nr:unnamed protein product [Heligmosomoides polygyrus]